MKSNEIIGELQKDREFFGVTLTKVKHDLNNAHYLQDIDDIKKYLDELDLSEFEETYCYDSPNKSREEAIVL